MPTWPSTIEPYSCSPPGILDPTLRFESDQGYSIRRPRHSRSRRLYQVTYWDNADVLLQIIDFIERELRGGAVSFSWDYPYAQGIVAINAATPNLVAIAYTHGLQTGDQVVITTTNSHNGTYTVTRVNPTHVTLNGTSGGSSEGAGGLVTQHFPFMSLQLDNDSLAPPELSHSFGPFRNNDSLARLTLSFKEEFA